MVNLTKSTKSVSNKDIKRNWHLIDVSGKVLGRIATEIVRVLQGKNKTDFVPYLDVGDNVVVINAAKVMLTGKKMETKTYKYFSGYPGGLREVTAAKLIKSKPEEIIKRAVSGMLPKNKLRDRRLARLHIFSGSDHSFKDIIK